ncbi:MAG: glycosyltransferase family 39 protein [Planctomycetota bacterium]
MGRRSAVLAGLLRDPWGYASALLLLAAAHAVLYLVDPDPQFYFGDSGSYLLSASGYVPPDRSWTYGFVIRWTALRAGSLAPLVTLQIAAHVLASWLLLLVAREFFSVSPRRGLVAAVLASLLPVHVVWTRYVMTEATALLAATAALAAALEYLRAPRWWWLAFFHVAGILAVTLRVVLLPLTLLAVVALPLLAFFGPRRRRRRRAAAHLGVGVLCVVALHGTYRQETGLRMKDAVSRGMSQLAWEPQSGYTQASGQFLLSYVAPLVRPEDFPPGLDGAEILAASVNVHDRRARMAQKAWSNGLFARLVEAMAATPGAVEAAPPEVAAGIARRAAWRDPLGVADVAVRNLADYFDREHFAGVIADELGQNREAPAHVRRRLARDYGFAWPDEPRPVSLLQIGYADLQTYLAFVAWGFLVVPWLVWRLRRMAWPSALLVGGAGLYFALVAALLSPICSSRFLLPISWLLWLLALGAFGRASSPRRAG